MHEAGRAGDHEDAEPAEKPLERAVWRRRRPTAQTRGGAALLRPVQGGASGDNAQRHPAGKRVIYGDLKLDIKFINWPVACEFLSKGIILVGNLFPQKICSETTKTGT